jgi:hypothetical protein
LTEVKELSGEVGIASSEIKQRVAEASVRWGRLPRIIAVCKTVAAEKCESAGWAWCFGSWGEQRQDLLGKMPLLDPKISDASDWKVANNKVKYIINIGMLDTFPDRWNWPEDLPPSRKDWLQEWMCWYR